jgi:hypothetical protein
MISNHDNQRCRGTKDHIRKEKDVCLKIYRYKGIRTGFSKIRGKKKGNNYVFWHGYNENSKIFTEIVLCNKSIYYALHTILKSVPNIYFYR